MKKVLTVILAVMFIVTLAVPAFAADVRPSVGKKIVEVGSVYSVDETGRKTVVEGLDVVLYNDRSDDRPDIKSALEKAYASILAVEDLGELDEKLDAIIKSINIAYDTSIFVISDVVYVDIPASYLGADGKLLENVFEIKFNVAGRTDETPVVMVQNPVSNQWSTVAPENVVKNDDGTITVRMEEEGSVAFLWVDPVKRENRINEFKVEVLVKFGGALLAFITLLSLLWFILWRVSAHKSKKLKKLIKKISENEEEEE